MKIFNILSVFALSILLSACQGLGIFDEPTPITTRVTVPDTTWKIRTEEIYETANETIVVARVYQQEDVTGLMVINQIQDSVFVDISNPDLEKTYFIIGKTWPWENPEDPNIYISSYNDQRLLAKLYGAKEIYDYRTKKSK